MLPGRTHRASHTILDLLARNTYHTRYVRTYAVRPILMRNGLRVLLKSLQNYKIVLQFQAACPRKRARDQKGFVI